MAAGLTLVADSSVWVSFYRKADTQAKQWLRDAISGHTVLVPDLVLVEVLRGIDKDDDARSIAREFENFEVVRIGGKSLALKATKHFRFLRSKAKTIRGTVDLLLATWCIENNIPLLHADRDFEPFEQHLGLKRWPVTIANPI